MFKANVVQVHIPKCGLGWQMTRFSTGATVSAKDFPGSSCHLVVIQDILPVFFPSDYHHSWLKQYFSRIGNVKNFWEMFSPGKP